VIGSVELCIGVLENKLGALQCAAAGALRSQPVQYVVLGFNIFRKALLQFCCSVFFAGGLLASYCSSAYDRKGSLLYIGKP